MAGSSDQRQLPVIQEGLEQLSQGKLLGLTIHERQQDGSEVALKSGAAL